MKTKIVSEIIAVLLTAMISRSVVSIANTCESKDSDIDNTTNGVNWEVRTHVWVHNDNPNVYEEKFQVAYQHCNHSAGTFYGNLTHQVHSITGGYNSATQSSPDYTSRYLMLQVVYWGCNYNREFVLPPLWKSGDNKAPPLQFSRILRVDR
ncbi:MAG: hypothetical protein NWF05_07415 [Candidatus Bathyarchaeota archaeon]|nr:hypothetical protein [Candidatus Bathyarchaeota archaeon]